MVRGRVGASFQRREIDVTVAGCRSESSVAFVTVREDRKVSLLSWISVSWIASKNFLRLSPTVESNFSSLTRERALIVNQISFKRIV